MNRATPEHRRLRIGFRARLTAVIAILFISGGTVLLGVQYLLTQQLFTSAIATFEVNCAGTAAGVSTTNGSSGIIVCGTASPPTSGTDGNTVTTEVGPAFVTQSAALSREVLSGLLFWSTVVLLIFAVLAVVSAWWITGSTLGRLTRITGTAQSITTRDLHQRLALDGPDDEIKELADALDTMLGRLEEGFTRQQQFIANASHELRTPITSARTALEIPLEQGRVPAELEPAIRRALTATEHSEQTIAALLTLTRITHDLNETKVHPLPGTHTVTAIRRCLEASLHTHRVLADAQGVTLQPDLDVKLNVNINVDINEIDPSAPQEPVPALLTIAIDNLIENAITHNKPGGFVWARVTQENAKVCLSIENTGYELSTSELAACTEPFNRGIHTRTYTHKDDGAARPGLGLGLPLALAAAERVGAQLSLSPRPLGGLTVQLCVPVE